MAIKVLAVLSCIALCSWQIIARIGSRNFIAALILILVLLVLGFAFSWPLPRKEESDCY